MLVGVYSCQIPHSWKSHVAAHVYFIESGSAVNKRERESDRQRERERERERGTERERERERERVRERERQADRQREESYYQPVNSNLPVPLWYKPKDQDLLVANHWHWLTVYL